MKTLGMWVLTIGMAVALAAPAQAQNRGRFGGGGMLTGGYMLLANQSVQKELKLDEAQVEKSTKIVTEVGAKMREKIRDVPKEEMRDKFAEVARGASEEVKDAVKDVLKPEQKTRLEQISRQQQGLLAFADPTVAKELKLSPDQRTKIREIAEESRGAAGRGGAAFNKDASEEERAEARRKMAANRKQGMDKAMAVLNDDQKKAWKDLTGEPFEVRFERPQ